MSEDLPDGFNVRSAINREIRRLCTVRNFLTDAQTLDASPDINPESFDVLSDMAEAILDAVDDLRAAHG